MRGKGGKNEAKDKPADGCGQLDSPGVSSRLRTRKQVSYVQDEEDESEYQDSKAAKPEANSRKRPAVPTPSESSAESVDSSDSDGDYEKRREQNIKDRLELFKSLGIADLKQDLGESSVKVKKRKYNKIKPPPPREKSKRIEDARAHELRMKIEPEVVQSTLENLPVAIDKATVRKPSGTLPMLSLKVPEEEVNKEDSVNAASKCAEFVSLLRPFLVHQGVESQLRNCSLDQFKTVVSGLTLSEKMIAKTNTAGITSIAFHPGEEKLLVASGGTRGDLAIWDVYNPDKEKCIEVLGPHTSEVSCTSFDCSDPSKILTTSLDGTLRRGDLLKLVFEEIWAHEQKEVHATWHDQVDPHTLMVAHGTGEVVVVDCRKPLQPVGWFECHEKSVGTVHKHPLENKYFVTASGMGQVRIWDWRMMDQTKPKPVWDLVRRKGVSSAFFSCKGNLLLTSCNDNQLRIYHTAILPGASKPKSVSNIKHYNYYRNSGTYFKAMWHPQREDVFLIGNAGQKKVSRARKVRARKLEILGIDGNTVHNLTSDHLVHIPAVNAWHPTLPIIAGSTSGGKVHIFR